LLRRLPQVLIGLKKYLARYTNGFTLFYGVPSP
jgi:hypothetical protein